MNSFKVPEWMDKIVFLFALAMKWQWLLVNELTCIKIYLLIIGTLYGFKYGKVSSSETLIVGISCIVLGGSDAYGGRNLVRLQILDFNLQKIH